MQRACAVLRAGTGAVEWRGSAGLPLEGRLALGAGRGVGFDQDFRF